MTPRRLGQTCSLPCHTKPDAGSLEARWFLIPTASRCPPSQSVFRGSAWRCGGFPKRVGSSSRWRLTARRLRPVSKSKTGSCRSTAFVSSMKGIVRHSRSGADRREPFLLSLRRDDRMKLVAVTPGEDPPEPADEPTDDPETAGVRTPKAPMPTPGYQTATRRRPETLASIGRTLSSRLSVWRWARVWLRSSFLPEQNYLIILAVVVGVITGLGSVGFIYVLELMMSVARGPVAAALGRFGPAQLVLLPGDRPAHGRSSRLPVRA